MTPEEAEQVQAHIRALAAILYKNTPTSELTNLETIEKSVRRQVLEHVSPNIALFLPLQVTGVRRGKTRRALKLCGCTETENRANSTFGSSSPHSLESVVGEVLLTLLAPMSPTKVLKQKLRP